MPLVQDRSLDLLTSYPTRYHCAADAPCRNVLYNTYTVIFHRTVIFIIFEAYEAQLDQWPDNNYDNI